MAEKIKAEIPLTTIVAATNGDETALKDVVSYFRDYMRSLSAPLSLKNYHSVKTYSIL